MSAQQLSFDLPARPALGRDDFMVSPGNAVAVAMIERWQDWPQHRCALIGPKGAGKSHLTHVWTGLTGAQVIQATALTRDAVPDLTAQPIAVEDVPDIAKDAQAQTALFHLANLCLAQGTPLLLTGDRPPAHWGLSLPDLASRMAALPVAALGPPDDTLLQAVLGKLFSDRQLSPRPDVVPFLARHMNRDFASAGAVVAAIDAAALAERRDITRRLAAEVLEALPQ